MCTLYCIGSHFWTNWRKHPEWLLRPGALQWVNFCDRHESMQTIILVMLRHFYNTLQIQASWLKKTDDICMRVVTETAICEHWSEIFTGQRKVSREWRFTGITLQIVSLYNSPKYCGWGFRVSQDSGLAIRVGVWRRFQWHAIDYESCNNKLPLLWISIQVFELVPVWNPQCCWNRLDGCNASCSLHVQNFCSFEIRFP